VSDWQAELDELARRKELVREMGGVERVERQHRAGRLTVRERVDALLDKGSFAEIGAITGMATYDEQGALTGLVPANSIFGRGTVDGRPVVVQGDDFTVRGGSADAAIWPKILMAETTAATFRMPLVRLIEGSGGGGSVKTIETTGRANIPNSTSSSVGFHLCVANLGQIPVVSLALGPVAGLGAARLVLSHYAVIVKEKASMFVAGPPVVERLGEKRTKEELGGWKVQTGSGAVDQAADTEEEAFAYARRFLDYLPSSVWDLPPRKQGWDPVDRRDEDLIAIVPKSSKQLYNMRRIVEQVVDRESFFEIGHDYGRPIITGLARLNGWPVALLAGDPVHGGGAWDAAACRKIVRFVELAETFHLPVVHLVDCPGLQVGLAAEQSGLIREGARAISAINQSTVPWCSVIIRNVFGVGGSAHQPHGRHCVRYAWPSGSWGSLPLEGGVEAAYKAEVNSAPDPAAKLAEIEARLNALRSPFRTAEAFWIEDIIDPRDTRLLLCRFADMAAPCRTPGKASFFMRP
jgi:acetyl-CoA carboxylase carboxyltransferase component